MELAGRVYQEAAAENKDNDSSTESTSDDSVQEAEFVDKN